jgi:hypothetical protein
MLEFLYSLFVWPFQAGIELFYLIIMQIIGKNIGLSIIISGIVINILLLPFYSVKENSEPQFSLGKRIKITSIQNLFSIIKPYIFMSFYAMLFISSNIFFQNIYFRYPPFFGIIKDLTKPDRILSFNLIPVAMLICAIIALIIIPVIKKKRIHFPSLAFMIFFLIIFFFLYKSSAMICLFWALTAFFFCLRNLIDSMKHPSKWYKGIILLGCFAFLIVIGLRYSDLRLTNSLVLLVIILATILITVCINSIQRFFEGPLFYSMEIHSLSIYRYSCIIIFLLSGLVIPLFLFSSSPTEFTSIGKMIVQTMLQASSLCFIMTFFYWEFSSKVIRRFLTIFMPFIVLLFLCSCFVFQGNYGIISSNLIFEEWKGSNQIIELGKSAAGILISALIVFSVFRFKKIQWLKNGLIILIFSFFVISGINSFSIMKELKAAKEIMAASEKNDTTQVFTFSRTGENIFVLFLDRATGFSMPDAFKLDPNLEKSLDGFTWYPNTATFGNYTVLGYPAMIGGYEYRPLELNKRSDEPLTEKVNEAIKVLPKIFGDAGYNVMITDPTYINLINTPDLSIFKEMKNVHAKNIKGIFRSRYDATQTPTSSSFYNMFNYDITIRFSFFRMLPSIARPILYNHGKWFKNSGASSYINLVDLFPNLLYLNDLCKITPDGNNFNFMMNDSVHNEGAHNRNLELISAPIIFSDEEIIEYGSIQNVEHTYTFSASLSAVGKWCEWLKQEGIYDNTKIIVVSDHGKVFGNSEMLHSDVAEMRNPLLLVKDFNSRGDFIVSNEFMTNADMPAIATSSLTKNSFEKVTNPFTGNEISSAQKKEKILIATGGPRRQSHNQNTFVINDIWEIKNQNILNAENWIELGKPE